MYIKYTKGKRSNKCFVPYATITFPETIKEYQDKLSKYIYDKTIRFSRRKSSLKTVLRHIRKLDLAKGTIVYVQCWYVGYADVMIYI